MDIGDTIIKGLIDNAEKIGIVFICVMMVAVILYIWNRDRKARDNETAADTKARELDHTERTQLTGILANQLVLQKESNETLGQVGNALIDMRREMQINLQKQKEELTGDLQKLLTEQNASFIRQIKTALSGGVRMQMGIMQLNQSGKIIMANEDAMLLLGMTDHSLLLNRQLYNLGLRVTDIDGHLIEDFNGLPFAGAIKTNKADTESALLGIQLPDFSWRWLLMNISPVLGPDQKIAQILLTFYDAGKLVVLDKLEKAEDITNHGIENRTLPSGENA